ncbi:N-acetyltransferase OS=Streptomyces fumanus OX=67302 GN=GCM10018772_47410 PE=4 SV=1 [Streptomyces fumanus]
MTTTLRPTEPVPGGGDGSPFTGHYQVCVTAAHRRELDLGPLPGFGDTVAAGHDLRVDEADRRRGPRRGFGAVGAEEGRDLGLAEVAAPCPPAPGRPCAGVGVALAAVCRAERRSAHMAVGEVTATCRAARPARRSRRGRPRPHGPGEFGAWREVRRPGGVEIATAWAERLRRTAE